MLWAGTASPRAGPFPTSRICFVIRRPDNTSGRPGSPPIFLSIKAPRRLAAICRAWARARHITRTYYLAPPAVARAVERAVRETRSEDQIAVLPIDQPEALVAINELEVANG